MSTQPQPQIKPAKPPKLKIDNMYGGENVLGKYRTLTDLVSMRRTHWWMRGYDVKVFAEDKVECRLACATAPSCTYNIVGEFTTFPELKGASGWRISQHGYNAQHNHPAPYVPMDKDVENRRRSTLTHDDPSLDNPPLVKVVVNGLAGSSNSGSGGAGGFARAGSTNAGSAHGALQFQQPPPPVGYGFNGGGGGGSGGSPSAFGGSLPGTPMTMPQQTPYNAPAQQQQQQFQAPPPHYQQPVPRVIAPLPRSTHQSSAATPTTSTNNPLVQTPLGNFLNTISPSFGPHLQRLESAGILLSTSPSELVALDDGSPSDRTVFNIFAEVQWPTVLVAMAADGVRKCKRRREAAGWTRDDEGSYDGRICGPIEKAKAVKTLHAMLEKGKQIVMQQQQGGLRA